MSDSEIIEKLLDGDDDFKKIYNEHRELDEKIKELENKESSAYDDVAEVRTLKKIKLRLKDKIEEKIRNSR
ncbi:MAG: YdcH family protein [Thermodesulfobacteriota bacterium]